MSVRFSVAVVAAVFVALAVSSFAHVGAQVPAIPLPYTPPKTSRGQPDLQGVWQAQNTAAWNIEDHSGATVSAGRRFEGNRCRICRIARQANRDLQSRLRILKPMLLPAYANHLLPFPFQILQFDSRCRNQLRVLTRPRYIYTTELLPDPSHRLLHGSSTADGGNSLVAMSPTTTIAPGSTGRHHHIGPIVCRALSQLSVTSHTI